MEKGKKIRLLRANEIECRVGTINEKGLSLLLYKDARVDQKLMDEIFGIYGWKRTHQMIGDSLYCTIEIWDSQKNQWIAKQDVGVESYTEKAKGQASDSFKRACFNIGLGRELYSAPFIWISADKASIEKKDNRYVCKDSFSVSEILYNDEREIVGLVIVNGTGKIVYEKAIPNSAHKNSMDRMENELKQELETELERTGVDMQTVLNRYHIECEEDMTSDICRRAINALKKTTDKKAA